MAPVMDKPQKGKKSTGSEPQFKKKKIKTLIFQLLLQPK
jgi:hypothetical protein